MISSRFYSDSSRNDEFRVNGLVRIVVYDEQSVSWNNESGRDHQRTREGSQSEKMREP